MNNSVKMYTLEGDERTTKGGRILCVACGMIM